MKKLCTLFLLCSLYCAYSQIEDYDMFGLTNSDTIIGSRDVDLLDCEPAANLTVNYNADCNAVLTWFPPGKKNTRELVLYETFFTPELPAGWSTLDVDGDHYTWQFSVIDEFGGIQYPEGHTGAYCINSASYYNHVGVLSPDNWLITPQLMLGNNTVLTYWIKVHDPDYPEDHYGVYISTSGTQPEDFTLLFEETLSTAQANWTQRIVNIPQTGDCYIAFRHFNSIDQYIILLDDIHVSSVIEMCTFRIEMQDAHGDGWDDSHILINCDGINYGIATLPSGSSGTAFVDVPLGTIQFEWVKGSIYDGDCSFQIYNYNDDLIYNAPVTSMHLVSGLFFSYENDCGRDLMYNIYRDGALIEHKTTETTFTDTDFNPTQAHIWAVTVACFYDESNPVSASKPHCLNTYTVYLSENPLSSGTFSGAGPYTEGTTATVSAHATTGYYFFNWTENGTPVNDFNPYSFIVNSNRTLVANFLPITYTITATAGANGAIAPTGEVLVAHENNQSFTFIPENNYQIDSVWIDGTYHAGAAQAGSYTFSNVTANHNIHVTFKPLPPGQYVITLMAEPHGAGILEGGGIYNEGETATVTATPADGYQFVNWTEDGAEIDTHLSFSFEVTANRVLVANFTIISYWVSTSANPAAGGTVTGGGVYGHGATANLFAIANAGYSFVDWTENGVQGPTSPQYSFKVIKEVTLVANFARNTYFISVSAYPTAGGTVTGENTYNHGDNVTVSATANDGYVFVHWLKDGTEYSTAPSYSFTATEEVSLVAFFKKEGGINDTEKFVDFQIYPNPTGNILHMVRPTANHAEIKIFNSTGLLVKSLNTNEIETIIDVSTLASGFYLIKLTDTHNSSVKRFVKE